MYQVWQLDIVTTKYVVERKAIQLNAWKMKKIQAKNTSRIFNINFLKLQFKKQFVSLIIQKSGFFIKFIWA